MKTPNNRELTLVELQQIELILMEASAWGLRVEVEQAAELMIRDGYDPIQSYEVALNDWVK